MQKSAILCVIHHRRSQLESTCSGEVTCFCPSLFLYLVRQFHHQKYASDFADIYFGFMKVVRRFLSVLIHMELILILNEFSLKMFIVQIIVCSINWSPSYDL